MAKSDLVEFAADGATYKLHYSVNALVMLEEMSGKSFFVIAAELCDAAKTTVTALRLFLWAGLQEHHKGMSVADVGDLIPKIGSMLDAINLVSGAFAQAFPKDGKHDLKPKLKP